MKKLLVILGCLFALVIVGGMVTTMILTLLVLPVVFTWAHRHRRPPSRDSDVNPTAAMLP